MRNFTQFAGLALLDDPTDLTVLRGAGALTDAPPAPPDATNPALLPDGAFRPFDGEVDRAGAPASVATGSAGESPQPETPVAVGDPAPERPPMSAPLHDPAQIDVNRILLERPDVLRGFYEAYHGEGNDRNSTAWMKRVGGDSPEAYAKYWYSAHGRYEGYAQGPTTAQDNVDLQRILVERPDVLRGFYESYFGEGNDRNSTAWMKRVGGDTPEAYAKYWYEKYGRWEGYAQTDKAAAEAIDVQRLLHERPDVFRGFFEEFYGPNNDRKSSAWVDRVGGDTVEDYAKYWYVAHGKREGYTQRPANSPDGSDGGAVGGSDGSGGRGDPPSAGGHDPAEDPWNHPAIFPDWRPPFEGWEPPPNTWHSLFEPDPFG